MRKETDWVSPVVIRNVTDYKRLYCGYEDGN